MLRPETERVWGFLRAQSALRGFIRVGGSALAVHLGHRASEDVELAIPADRLPRADLDAVTRAASAAGLELLPHDDPAALRAFGEGGLDLRDYRQDFLANRSVKVSCFAPEPPLRAVLDRRSRSYRPRLATLEELFQATSLLTASRSRTRDWYDLYVLMTRCGFSMAQYREAFVIAGIADQAAVGWQRLCQETAPAVDEGFEPLVPDAPPVEAMQAFFRSAGDAFERDEAARAWREAHPDAPSAG